MKGIIERCSDCGMIGEAEPGPPEDDHSLGFDHRDGVRPRCRSCWEKRYASFDWHEAHRWAGRRKVGGGEQ
ncbi:MAG: hypothetical protein ACRD0J_15885 [Acidimicrobiales bacterium]